MVPIELVGGVVEPGGDRVRRGSRLNRVRGEQFQRRVSVGFGLVLEEPILLRRRDHLATGLEGVRLVSGAEAYAQRWNAGQRLPAVTKLAAHVVEPDFAEAGCS